jgi:methionyl-tRNA formyltransferase
MGEVRLLVSMRMRYINLISKVNKTVLEIPSSILNKYSLASFSKLMGIVKGPCTSDDYHISRLWIEKLIRLIEVNRSDLFNVFVERFSGEKNAVRAASDIIYILSLTANPLDSQEYQLHPDLRSLNAALYLSECARLMKNKHSKNTAIKGINNVSLFLDKLPSLVKNRGKIVWNSEVVQPAKFADVDNYECTGIEQSVVVLCPNYLSLNTIATLFLLYKKGVKVEAIAVRKLLTLNRIRSELKFSIRLLFKRVMNEALLRGKKTSSKNGVSLNNYLELIGCKYRNVKVLAKIIGAKVVYFGDFNDSNSVKYFQESSSDYAVFTGGGILNSSVLNSFSGGIIHCHPGILPQYKGMDVVHWALLEGSYDQVGASCQIMNDKLDAGELCGNIFVDVKKVNGLMNIRTKVVEDKIHLLANMTAGILLGAINKKKQTGSGFQYFLMHHKLLKITEYAALNVVE